jgi:hypothetical protein
VAGKGWTRALAVPRQLVRNIGFDVVRYSDGKHPRYSEEFDGDTIEIIDAVRPYTMTTAQRIRALLEATRYVARYQIKGDMVECGVWRGGSMMAVALMLDRLGDEGRTLYLYDTFAGMTGPSQEDTDYKGLSASERLRRGSPAYEETLCLASLEEVQTNLGSVGYRGGEVRYLVGPVEETIPATVPDQIALLRLDTDWYESTKHELVHLFPLIVNGGVLILDDYGYWEGVKKAVDEYVEATGTPLLLNRIDHGARLAVVWRPADGDQSPTGPSAHPDGTGAR